MSSVAQDARRITCQRILKSEVSPCCQSLALALVGKAYELLDDPMVSWDTEGDTITFEEVVAGGRGRLITVTGDCYQ